MPRSRNPVARIFFKKRSVSLEIGLLVSMSLWDCRFKSFDLAIKICQQAANPALGVFFFLT